MTLDIKRFDAAEHILDDQDARFFLEAALAETTTDHLSAALDTVIRAKGLEQLARETGMSREHLNNILNPWGSEVKHEELLTVFKALGVSGAENSDAA